MGLLVKKLKSQIRLFIFRWICIEKLFDTNGSIAVSVTLGLGLAVLGTGKFYNNQLSSLGSGRLNLIH